jgi:hypothetical protein
MLRRNLVLASPGVVMSLSVWAHHGWSSFDQEHPLWIEGKVIRAKWQNPHAELELEVPPNLRLPADLPRRALPRQAAPVDGPALLARATVPMRKDRRWAIELAPLTRLESWKVSQINPGTQVGVLGFAFKRDQDPPVLRAEFLFVEGKVYGLRSSPV